MRSRGEGGRPVHFDLRQPINVVQGFREDKSQFARPAYHYQNAKWQRHGRRILLVLPPAETWAAAKCDSFRMGCQPHGSWIGAPEELYWPVGRSRALSIDV